MERFKPRIARLSCFQNYPQNYIIPGLYRV